MKKITNRKEGNSLYLKIGIKKGEMRLVTTEI